MISTDENTEKYLKQLKPTVATNTFEQIRWMLVNYVQFMNGRTPTPQLIDEWSAAQIEAGRSAAYVTKHRTVVKRYFEWRVRLHTWNGSNPVATYRMRPDAPVRRRPFTSAEYEILITTCKMDWLRALVMVAWHTGLRMGDAAMMRWESVNQIERVVSLVTTKNNKAVQIPFGEEMAVLFDSRFGLDPTWVIEPAATHYRYDRNKTLSVMFGRLADRSGLPGRCFHCLRHAFVSRHLAAGANPAVLATITGHSLGAIMSYVTTSLDTKRSAIGLA